MIAVKNISKMAMMLHISKSIILLTIISTLLLSSSATFASDDETKSQKTADQTLLSGLKLSGGISAGYFFASNPGVDASGNEFLLSNFLVEISSKDDTQPIGFTGAFGQTSTPSLLGTPEKNEDFDIEYASLSLKPLQNMGIEMGLLQPNSGFECTYTFNNKNVILGALASQQPYNAYGVRVSYDVSGVSLWGGYYKNRLDDEEYSSPDYAWEIGLCGSIADNDFSIYNYHIEGQRNLLGAVLERTIKNIDLAFNIDYWTWDDKVKDLYGSRSSIGGAVYISPNFGNFSLPVRLEYINQKASEIYIESAGVKKIYATTISPTWHFTDKSYIRAESAYVKADGAFADKNGNIRDNRTNIAIELGYLF
jgi:hypothetical protein